MAGDLVELVKRLGEPRVAVVGDAMLDRYVWGDADRISQEAPVILLQADRREERLGGAASVATMLAALGAKVSLASVVGDDSEGIRVQRMLAASGVDTVALLPDESRPTTLKERYIGRAQQRHPQQMIRVDYEVRTPLSTPLERTLFDRIESQISTADIVLVSDYGKGMCTPSLMRSVVAACRRLGKRLIADPLRGGDYEKYRGCSAITPNRLEAGLALGTSVRTIDEALRVATKLRDDLELEAAVVTLDKDGMVLAGRGNAVHFATRARQVYDITGAGDMVLAVLGLALAVGADYADAVRLANAAGGLEVERVGVATITRDELIADLLHMPTVDKVFDLPELLIELGNRRRGGHRIAFTNGCFDILHAGHVQYLREARAQADVLIVGLNSDAGVRSLKGNERPINDIESRALVLGALQAVDGVVVFDEPTPAKLIEAIRPDVLVKGSDYEREQIVGADFVESYGGRVHRAVLRPGASTSAFLRKIKAA